MNQTDLLPPATGFVGWTRRPGSRGRWRRVCEAPTERECNRLLEEATSGMQHKAVFVAPSSVDANARPTGGRR